jgi:hypothetical protein
MCNPQKSRGSVSAFLNFAALRGHTQKITPGAPAFPRSASTPEAQRATAPAQKTISTRPRKPPASITDCASPARSGGYSSATRS